MQIAREAIDLKFITPFDNIIIKRLYKKLEL